MAKEAASANLCRLFRVLSDRTRVKLLLVLRDGEQRVTELCHRLRVPQPTVSHHLALLRMSGLVRNRRQGRSVYYSVNTVAFRRALEGVAGVFAR